MNEPSVFSPEYIKDQNYFRLHSGRLTYAVTWRYNNMLGEPMIEGRTLDGQGFAAARVEDIVWLADRAEVQA